jgi:hypothetical protein
MIQKLFLFVFSLFLNFFPNKKLLFYTFVFTAFGLWSGYGQTNTWTGTTSTAWSTAANWSLNAVPIAGHDVVIPNVTNKPIVSAVAAVCTTLTINAGSSLTVSQSLTVSGTTSVSGTLTVGSTTGTKQFTGLVTINTGGTWTNTINSNINFRGGVTNNGTFTAGSGSYTFTTNAQAVTGSLTIPNVAVTGINLTNNGTLTVSTMLSGTGTLTNASGSALTVGGTTSSITTLANAGTMNISGSVAISTILASFTNTGTLNLGGTGTIAGITNNAGGTVNLTSSGTITSFNNATATSILNISAATVPTITTLTTTAAGNTVNYSGASQTVKVTTYSSLVLSGSGTKTIGGAITVNSNLSIASGILANLGTFTHTANSLTLGGAGTLSGSWGSNTSSATNKSNVYFSATTGIVNVAGGCNTAVTVIPNKLDKCSTSNNGSISPTFTGGLANVRYIKLTNKYNGDGTPDSEKLQIAEIQAFEVFTGNNVALSSNGGVASASSVYSTDYPVTEVNDNISNVDANMWHGGGSNDWVQIDLQSAKNLDYLRIYNRVGCCQFRAQNILLELFDGSNNLIYCKTINVYEGVNASHSIDVNVLDISWTPVYATSLNRTDLNAGTYTLNYADGAGYVVSTPIAIVASDPTITTAATSAVVTAACQSASIQTTTLAYTAAANSPISYSIDWATLTDQTSTPFVFAAGGGSITGISVPAGTAAGTYSGTMTITNANGCTATKDVTLTITPTVGTPTAITVSAGSEPTCQLTNGTTTTTYATTATNNTGFNWSLSNSSAGFINGTTGVMTWSNGFSGSVDIRVTANGCNGASSLVTRSVIVNALPSVPTVGTITNISCITNTGSVVLNGLPSGSWTINQSGNAIASYSDNTNSYTVTGLASGSYTFTVSNASGCPSSATGSVPITDASSTTWNGTSWSNGAPNATKNAIIVSVSPNSPFTADLSACALTINNSSGVVTVPSGITLTITNGITVSTDYNLVFENNASLVQINNATNIGKIIYKRISAPMKDFDYTYWSSPVAGQTLFDLSPNTLFDKYMSFSGTGWQISYGGITVMQPGIGYIIRTPKERTWPAPHPEVVSFPYYQAVQFKGVPNNGNITSTQSMIKDNFYLIGNPYPSALYADDFLSDNDAVLNGTIYLWTHNTAVTNLKYTSNDYASYNGLGGVATSGGAKPSGYIAAGQSFFASAEANGDVVFNNSMRAGGNNNAQFFKPGRTAKTGKLEKHRLWLNMTNTAGAFKQTLIGYAEGATNNFDDNFDGLTFDGNSYLDLYSINGSDNLTIQGRALPFVDTDLVPLGYRSTVAGSFTIAINQADGVLANQRVYLEDKQTNTINDLTAQNYTFSTTVGTFNNRFVLRYTNKTLGTGDFETVENSVTVVSQDKTIVISSPKENIDKVFIYNVSGKQLFKKQSVGNLELSIQHLPFAQQVLLVKVVLENGYTTTKKLIFK